MKKQHSLLFNTALIYFIVLLAFVLVRILFQLVAIPISELWLDFISTVFVQIGLMFLLPVLMFSTTQRQSFKQTFKDFGYAKIGGGCVVIALLIGIFCYFLNLSISSFFSSLIRLLGYETVPTTAGTAVTGDYSFGAFILSVVTVAVIPAVCEETTHRGLLIRGFSSLGLKTSIILSSLLFGLMHLNINQFFYATVLGFIIALAVIVSKNIVPAIIIHFVNNFLSVYFSFARVNGWVGKGFNQFMDSLLYSDNLFLFFFTNLLMLLTLIVIIVLLFTLLLRETRIKRVRTMLNEISNINREYKADSSAFNQDENFMNLHFLNGLMKQYNIKSLNSMVFTELESKKKKPTSYEVILLASCFVVGILVTAFTFVWGVL